VITCDLIVIEPTWGHSGVPVKRSQGVLRALAVLDQIAARQPIGVSALAKLLEEDRSAVQRTVMTLADAGWIRPAPEAQAQWELSAHIYTLALLPRSSASLRERARPVLEEICARTGETAFLALPDVRRFVAIQVAESPHILRAALRVGQIILPRESATGRAMLPYFDPRRQEAMLGHPPAEADLREFAATRARGFGLSAGDVMPGATSLAAPVFDAEDEAEAALVVSGPSERLTPERHAEIGALLARNAASLSRGAARPARMASA
jgi:IclR family acetate operon transcriptional repressor